MYEKSVLHAAQCLKQNEEKILALWSERARQELPAASHKSEFILRDALPNFLNNLVRALSPNEPANKAALTEVSKEHGEQRSELPDYSLRQVVAEYSLLQKTIFDVLEVETCSPLSCADRDTILEAISIGIKEAAVEFSNHQMFILKRSNEALEHFAHIASHDLREPLRTIVNHLQLIQVKFGSQLDDEKKKSFDFAIQGAARMKALIDSLLLYSEVAQPTDKAVVLDFNLALERVISSMQVAIDDSKTQVIYAPLPTLLAFPIEIERLFQNLISNAIKFHGDKPPIIMISAMQKGPQWIFLVSDNGIGIKADQQGKIFEMFSRLHSNSQYPGSGIGLAVCRKVAELHGGSIWCEPNINGGTTFQFSIPNNR